MMIINRNFRCLTTMITKMKILISVKNKFYGKKKMKKNKRKYHNKNNLNKLL